MLILKSKMVNFFKRKTVVNIHLTIDVDEIGEDEMVELIQAVGTHGYFTFSSDKLKKQVEEIMKNRKIGIRESGYSHSQVLRGKLRLLWEKDTSGKSWEEFYDYKMNQIIEHFDSKIQKRRNTNTKIQHS